MLGVSNFQKFPSLSNHGWTFQDLKWSKLMTPLESASLSFLMQMFCVFQAADDAANKVICALDLNILPL